MEEDDHPGLRDRYRSLSIPELLDLHQRRSELTRSAQLALDQEMARRPAHLSNAKQERDADAAADVEQASAANKAQLKRDERTYRLLDWCMVVATPFVVLSLISEPPWQSTPMNGPKILLAATVVLWWIGSFVRWWRSGAPPNKSLERSRDA